MPRDHSQLTARQAQCLAAIQDSITKRGFPPTLREIGDSIGIRSTNGVSDHLVALERKGYIVRSEMKSRGIVLVEATPVATLGDAVRWWTWDEPPATGSLIVARGYFEPWRPTLALSGAVRRGSYLYVLANATPEMQATLKGLGFKEWASSPL
ncbi:LexA repressor, DNA-binding domain containing protein [uncultured Caudovirales phage]|uniref:LexA repressor, DNA-binding domain containing protein n=1 Tax=uncultured Caudovirales phage TaxID=2100421 RepID=A0A6J5N588_9CAUD|nr:LexA repressor, DNA-binding domain containing protein [uncultured Caudovirales phage]